MATPRLAHVLGVGLAAGTLVLGAVPAHAATLGPPIAEGLVGPLGLAIGDDGSFHVAEAFAGQVTTIGKKGSRTSIQADGGTAGVDARGKGTLTYTVTISPEGEPQLSYLYTTNPSGKSRLVASLSDYEAAANPDAGNTYGFANLDPACAAQLPPFLPATSEGGIDSNAYSVATVPGGWLVADAGGNSIVRVRANGQMSTVAVLPPVPQLITDESDQQYAELGLPECVVGQTYDGEPVPTDVEVGPDGNYYVSSLPGFPEAPGTGSVWRIDSRTGALTQVASGFSGAVDIAVAADATIYVAELFGGQISAIAPDGSTSVVVADVEPGALEIGRNGTLYATLGIFSGQGVLVPIQL